ncbi:MAG TPA: hypothetical protein VN805_06890 [Caulobacteraceae bacterium]|nr:hypothetical protein [Caulobacteraceae bacterium]
MDPNDPWSIPPVVKQGDAEPSTVWRAVGEALTNWEWVEGHLALLFNEMVSPATWSAPAHRAYGSIVAYAGRADLIKSAAETFFLVHPDTAWLQAKFDTTMKLLGRASPRRNDIAHGIVQPLHPEGDGFALYPSFYATRRRDVAGLPAYAMSSVQIGRFGQQFFELQMPVKEIVDGLAAKRLAR